MHIVQDISYELNQTSLGWSLVSAFPRLETLTLMTVNLLTMFELVLAASYSSKCWQSPIAVSYRITVELRNLQALSLSFILGIYQSFPEYVVPPITEAHRHSITVLQRAHISKCRCSVVVVWMWNRLKGSGCLFANSWLRSKPQPEVQPKTPVNFTSTSWP